MNKTKIELLRGPGFYPTAEEQDAGYVPVSADVGDDGTVDTVDGFNFSLTYGWAWAPDLASASHVIESARRADGRLDYTVRRISPAPAEVASDEDGWSSIQA